MVCGTAALHRQASTAGEHFVSENTVLHSKQPTTVVGISESVVLNEVVVYVAVRRALYPIFFYTLIVNRKFNGAIMRRMADAKVKKSSFFFNVKLDVEK